MRGKGAHGSKAVHVADAVKVNDYVYVYDQNVVVVVVVVDVDVDVDVDVNGDGDGIYRDLSNASAFAKSAGVSTPRLT